MRNVILYVFLIITNILMAKEAYLPTEKSLIEGELKNGLKYTIDKNAKPKNRAELRLVVKVGSLDEEEDQRGVAHFVEHMAFNGSRHFAKNELVKYLESTGVKFGAHLNASTGYEKTLYKLTIPLEKDNLEKSFLIFQDWAEGLSFDPHEFDKERGVVLEEARARDTMGLRLYNQSKNLYFNDSKYMKRLPIGKKDIIKNISVHRAKAFYDLWYRPELMHFIAVGDFNTSRVEKLIEKYFSVLKNVTLTKRAPRKIKDINTTRVLSITDKELTSNAVSIFYADTLQDTRTNSDMRRDIVESMMLSLFNMKAKEQILKNNPKATSISFTTGATNEEKGIYSFDASYNNGDGKLAFKELYALIKSFSTYGFSADDLKSVKEDYLQSNEQRYNRISDMRSSTIASLLVGYALRHSIYVDYDYKHKINKELIGDIKLDEINAMFKNITQLKERSILFVDINSSKIDKKEILTIMENAKAKDLTKVKKLPSKLLNKELNSSKILSTVFDKKTNSYSYLLQNGVHVLFKPSDYSKNIVLLRGFSFGGYSLYEADSLDNVRKASSFVNASGAGEFTNIDLDKILVGKNISVKTSILGLSENIRAYCNSEDIESMFELMYLKLTKAKIDKRVEKNKKKVLKARAKEQLRSPRNRFHQESLKWYYKNSPRILFDTVKSVEKLDGDTMLKIYNDRFSDFNNFDFAIIGDINKSSIESLISRYLGNLPSKKREETFIDRKIEHLKSKQIFRRNYNNEKRSNIKIVFKSKVAYSKKRALALKAMTSILNVRLRELIREEKSGVYGIRLYANISRLKKDKAYASIKFSCSPKRKDEIISYVYGLIANIKEVLVDEKELDMYKKKVHVSYETNMKKNGYWLAKMISTFKFHEPLNEIFDIPTYVDSISKKEILEISNLIFSKDILQSELNPVVVKGKI